MSVLGIITRTALDYSYLVPWMYSLEYSSLSTALAAITTPLSLGIFLVAASIGGGVGIAGLLSMLYN